MTEYVVGLMFADSAESVALVLKAGTTKFAGRLNGPGGRVESGETPAAAMVREFKEAAGVETAEADWTLGVVLKLPAAVIYFHTSRRPDCCRLAGRPDEPVRWYSRRHLPPAVLHNLRWIIPLAGDAGVALPVVVDDAGAADTLAESPERRREYQVGKGAT